MIKPLRLWLLTNTSSPYQVEFFSAIHRSGKIALDVRFFGLTHRGHRWQPPEGKAFPHVELNGFGPGGRGAHCWKLHPRALREVLVGKHDFYVLSGHYTSLTFLVCALILWLRRKRWGVWLERPWPEDYRPAWARRLSSKSSLVRAIRNVVLKAVLRKATKVLCIGSAAIEAYRQLGTIPEKLVLLPYICDTKRYGAPDVRQVAEIRQQQALEGKTVFLFSGALIERKGPDVLLEAFAGLARERSDVALVVLGEGPMRAGLEDSPDGPVRDAVRFVGHVKQADLPAWFAAADVFVFPSRHDGWAVVINEACAAGLPIITTGAVGAAHDLVIDEENGYVLARDDVKEFAEKMRYLADNPRLARRYGERSRQLVEKFSLAAGVKLLYRAIERGSEHHTPQPARTADNPLSTHS